MTKRVALALAVLVWLAAQPAGIRGESPGPSNVEGTGLSVTTGGTCRTIAAIVRVYPAFEVRTEVSAGCRVLASGPTSSIVGEVPPDAAVRELLQQDGWEEDPAFAADGPGTTSFALRKRGISCLVSAGAPSGIEDGTFFTDEIYEFDAMCAQE